MGVLWAHTGAIGCIGLTYYCAILALHRKQLNPLTTEGMRTCIC